MRLYPVQTRIAKARRSGLTASVQFEFLFPEQRKRLGREATLQVGDRRVSLHFVRNAQARRYLLRVQPDRSVRVTVPRGGTFTEGMAFASRSTRWLEKQLRHQDQTQGQSRTWTIGTEILFRGESVCLRAPDAGAPNTIQFGDETFVVADASGDLRPEVEHRMWHLAARELPQRVSEYVARHQLPVRRVTVRNQRSRWGSCSRRGTISLNWRLIQTPPWVRDYIILHELMHLREMNHSPRFWRAVARVCPAYQRAEQWLKQHTHLLA